MIARLWRRREGLVDETIGEMMERGESRRELEQVTAEAVLYLLKRLDCDGVMGDRLRSAIYRYRKCRGLVE